jgi:hypothetical protein
MNMKGCVFCVLSLCRVLKYARCEVEANMNSGVGLLIFCCKICCAF